MKILIILILCFLSVPTLSQYSQPSLGQETRLNRETSNESGELKNKKIEKSKSIDKGNSEEKSSSLNKGLNRSLLDKYSMSYDEPISSKLIPIIMKLEVNKGNGILGFFSKCRLYTDGFPNVASWMPKHSPSPDLLVGLKPENTISDVAYNMGARRVINEARPPRMVWIGSDDPIINTNKFDKVLDKYNFRRPRDVSSCVLFYADFIYSFLQTISESKIASFPNKDGSNTVYIPSNIHQLINDDVVKNFTKLWKPSVSKEIYESLKTSSCEVPNGNHWYGGTRFFKCGPLYINTTQGKATISGFNVIGDNNFWGVNLRFSSVNEASVSSFYNMEDTKRLSSYESQSMKKSSNLEKLISMNRRNSGSKSNSSNSSLNAATK